MKSCVFLSALPFSLRNVKRMKAKEREGEESIWHMHYAGPAYANAYIRVGVMSEILGSKVRIQCEG